MRFESRITTDVAREKIRAAIKTERGCDPLYFAHGLAVIQEFTQSGEAAAMHEHHAIHHLHSMLPASIKHLAQICDAHSTWLFAKHMLAGGRGAQNPFLAQSCRQWNVNCINLV